MAKSLGRHQERLAAVALLGKDLARRAERRCEWCGDKDDLRPYDHAPDREPSLETLALLCARCREVVKGGGAGCDPRALRFLEGAVWSEVPAVREPAIRVLRALAAEAPWARDALEHVSDQAAVEDDEDEDETGPSGGSS